MQLVAVRQTLAVPIEFGCSQVKLEAGRRYVMHDEEVARGQEAGVWKTVTDLPDRPTKFVGEVLRSGLRMFGHIHLKLGLGASTIIM